MFGATEDRSYVAITRMDRWKSGGLFTMLRCRGTDRIRFESSCRWVINYQQEFFSSFTRNPRHQTTPKKSFVMPYRSCVCYYGRKP